MSAPVLTAHALEKGPHWRAMAVRRHVRQSLLAHAADSALELPALCDAVARHLRVSRVLVRLEARAMLCAGSLEMTE